MRNNKFLLIFLLSVCLKPVFSQHLDILNTGSFKGELNGQRFDTGIRFGTSENLFVIEASDDDFVLIIIWRDIGSIDEIKKQFIKLPAEDDRVSVTFIEKNTNFIITGGLLHIYRKDSQGLNGTIEFTARNRFTKNNNDQRASLLEGNFSIDLVE
ncbi:MAG TPA: hypothetical protein VMT35_09610 [Ignavibacteriaceae bacterium]|nr:hypothetical protein [Ignavibacteriaceae bacterium]